MAKVNRLNQSFKAPVRLRQLIVCHFSSTSFIQSLLCNVKVIVIKCNLFDDIILKSFYYSSFLSPSVSFGYMLNGFFVGWSSKFFSFDEELSDSIHVRFFNQFFKIETLSDSDDFLFVSDKQFHRSQISWIISGFPLGVVIASLLLYKLYYHIGTKFSLLAASFLILLSWTLTMPFG